jgi:hypothetical protein
MLTFNGLKFDRLAVLGPGICIKQLQCHPYSRDLSFVKPFWDRDTGLLE